MSPEQERLALNLVAVFCLLAIGLSFIAGANYTRWKQMRQQKREDRAQAARWPHADKR